MPKISTSFEPKANGITERNLLLSIWLRPTATLRLILATCPDAYVIQLLVLGELPGR